MHKFRETINPIYRADIEIYVPCKLYQSIDSCGGSYSVGTVNFTIIEKWGVDATDHVLDMTGHAFVCWSS